jgi:ABC transporter substrate binding protein
VATRGARAAGRFRSADRRADRVCGERSGCAVLAWGVPGHSREARLDGRQQSPNRSSLGWDDPDRIKTFAKELVDLRPDAILSVTTPVTGALIRETQTIPIVIVTVADPISSGFVANLGVRAVILPGSPFTSPRWAGNGWNCSSKSRRA